MIFFDRRAVLGALVGLFALAVTPAIARTVTDSAGRSIDVPDKITRVFAAGPPASVLLYVLAPQNMIGWVRAPREAEKPFLLPAVRELPELGRLTGRGDTLNLERLMAVKPDLIIDFGTINDTRSLADRVQAQTGIPYLLVDGRLENTPSALRLLADVLDVKDRGEALARLAEETFAQMNRVLVDVLVSKRPRVYLARGPEGLETGSRGSLVTEIIERVGGFNVVEGLREKGGIVNVPLEQLIAWSPDTIVTLDRGFRGGEGKAGMAAGARRAGRPRFPGAKPAVWFHRRPALGESFDRPHLAPAQALSRACAGRSARAGALVLSPVLSGRTQRCRPRSAARWHGRLNRRLAHAENEASS